MTTRQIKTLVMSLLAITYSSSAFANKIMCGPPTTCSEISSYSILGTYKLVSVDSGNCLGFSTRPDDLLNIKIADSSCASLTVQRESANPKYSDNLFARTAIGQLVDTTDHWTGSTKTVLEVGENQLQYLRYRANIDYCSEAKLSEMIVVERYANFNLSGDKLVVDFSKAGLRRCTFQKIKN